MVRWTSRLVLLAPLLAACSSSWSLVDQDGDGVSPAEGDCWDAKEGPAGTGLSGADIFPGAAETWYDGFDQNCAGDNDFDADADGYVPTAYAADAGDLPSGDCDDSVATVNPGATDEWYDGLDSDCAGNDDYDQDSDGFVATEYAGMATTYIDGSGSLPGDDCDDTLDTINPDATDTWYDGIDTDCAGNDDYDQDADGYVPLEYSGLATTYVAGSGALPAGDCDDTDPGRVPDPTAPVVWYNGYDERCDENDGDQDGDGYWASDYAARVAASGSGEAPLPIPTGKSGDCFDDAADRPSEVDSTNVLVPINGGTLLDPDQVHPGASDEPYDGVDADCASDSDFDKDGDGYDSECVYQRDGSTGNDCLDDDDPGACGEADPAGLGALGVYPGAIDTWYDGTDANCDSYDDWDADYDGYIPNGYSSVYTGTLSANDCDDTDNSVNPGESDTWYDGEDTNCSGNDDYDKDGDGYVPTAYVGLTTTYVSGSGGLPGNDCDDAVSTVNPGRTDTWYDGIDTNCSGNDDFDKDSDGYVPDLYVGRTTTYVSGSGALPGNDCDDTSASVNPGHSDTWYDGVDSNCGSNDDYDRDGDGYVPDAYVGLATTYVSGSGSLPGNDCDDTVASVNPAASDTWYDGVDKNCSGNDDYDKDSDGYVPTPYVGRATTYVSGSGALPGNDCDDTTSAVSPGHSDTWYDGVDSNCGGNDDYDKDSDGYVPTTYVGLATTYVSGSGSLPGNDCDDTVASVNPAASDTWYDGVDKNCSGNDDYDQDADGYVPTAYVGLATTYVSGSGGLPGNDCDDTVVTVNPSRTDTWYDGIDTNCSGNDDYDKDSDGYVPTSYVGRATTYVSGSGALPGNDCDDTTSAVNPGHSDTWYDGVDSNCGGNDDYDKDSDSYVPTVYVGLATTYVSGSGSLPGNDCDDTTSAVNPGHTDTWYDGVDSNCSGNDDYDKDSDLYVPTAYVGRATTYVSGSGALPGNDCDDTTSAVNPGHSDSWYDGVDSNCSSNDDYDKDSDLYVPTSYVGLATTYVSGSGSLPGNDCNDANAAINPAATETWYDGTDQNCDGLSDNDADADSYDSSAHGGTDCNDANSAIHPGATEIWYDGVDQNCSGGSDYDADADTYDISSHSGGTDCNDANSAIHPGATEIWYDGVDQNCSGGSDYDADGDTYDISSHTGGTDCNDASSAIHPGATEVWYDGTDQDCSGGSDYDFDGDGHDIDTYAGGDDCNDADTTVHFGAPELDDMQDNDCDEYIDEDFVSAGDLIIDEAMINGIGSGTETNEWFEVYNTTAYTLFLDDWQFQEQMGGNNSFYVSPDAALSILPHDYLVFCYSATVPDVTCDYVYGANTYINPAAGVADNASWQLGNSGGALTITMGTVMMDAVTFSSSTFPYSDGVSAELGTTLLDATSNDAAASWCAGATIYSTSGGYNYGTPGAVNDCVP